MAKTPKASAVRGPSTPFLFPIFTVLLLLFFVFAQPGSCQKTTIVVTAAPAIPSTVPDFVSDAAFTSAILNSTNVYREAHNASEVVWNETLEAFATDYLDDVGTACTFAHSGGPYGENLAIGYANATASVEAWGDEGKKYNFRKPGFSEATGHFTQLVWKNTTDVGCGRRLCGERGWYLVCEYWPRGNIIGAFQDEVGESENSSTGIRPGWLSFATISVFIWILS